MSNDTDSPRWPLLLHYEARLDYGRLLWRRPGARARLLRHWTDPRHPNADRFSREYRALVECVLMAGAEEDDVLDAELRKQAQSLRSVVREIPPVSGSFY